MDRRSNNPDHDLLIEIKTELSFVRTEVKDMKENIIARIVGLEAGKASGSEVADHETRLRTLERWGWKAIGALGVIQAIVTILLSLRK